MFLNNSRYAGVPTVTTQDGQGRAVQAVTLRRLPDTAGEATRIRDHDQLDIMSERRYRDATRFWYIADANSELEANELVHSSGRVVNVPPG